MKKAYTIWKYYLLFSDSIDEIKDGEFSLGNSFVYKGEVDKIPIEIAEKVAEIHHNCFDYFEKTMMILYKTYGRKRSGTENPVFSIKTKCDKPYVLITEILDCKKKYPKE